MLHSAPIAGGGSARSEKKKDHGKASCRSGEDIRIGWFSCLFRLIYCE